MPQEIWQGHWKAAVGGVNQVLRKTFQCLSWNLLGSDMTDGKELLKEHKNLWFVDLQDQSHPWPRLCLEAQTQQGWTGLACLHKGLFFPRWWSVTPGSLLVHSSLGCEESCPKVLHADTSASGITITIFTSNWQFRLYPSNSVKILMLLE